MLFGTWPRDKTFPKDDGRSTHKDYSGARFQRHLDAVDEIRGVATRGGLSVAQLCVGVLLHTPGLTGVIAGARNARQGAMVPSLGVGVGDEQARQVWAIAETLARDLESM
jgi:aryl-alcohol dehydrogenase-like predicted oxidoreductase